MLVNIGFESAKERKLKAVIEEAPNPNFAVPSLPAQTSVINVSQATMGAEDV